MVKKRNHSIFVTCQTPSESEDEQITFDAIEVSLGLMSYHT
jgi:hypothetical protein